MQESLEMTIVRLISSYFLSFTYEVPYQPKLC